MVSLGAFAQRVPLEIGRDSANLNSAMMRNFPLTSGIRQTSLSD